MRPDRRAPDGTQVPAADQPRPWTAQERDVLLHVPLLAAYFQRARGEMPPQLRRTFDTHRLTARHGAVLPQLVGGQQFSVTELAARLGVSLSTASELVGSLGEAGLVERAEDPANRRRTLVSLREEYRPAVEAFLATRSAPLLRALATLSEEERAGFRAGLAAWSREAQP